MNSKRKQVRLQLHPATVRAVEAYMATKGCCFSAAVEQLIHMEVKRDHKKQTDRQT